MTASVEGRLRAILAKNLCCAEARTIDNQTSLEQGLGIDSLDLVVLALAVEEEFGIGVMDAETAWEGKTLSEIAALIHSAGQAQGVRL